MKSRKSFLLAVIAVAGSVLVSAIPSPAQTVPQTRVVRLSFVEGNVTVQRPEVATWSEAPVNTPLQQGFKFSTGDNSFAEIQFENGSAIRLGERSLLDLTALAVDLTGKDINRVNLRQGYATFHPLSSRRGNSLQVETPFGVLIANGGAEFRVDLDQGMERVEVFDGSIEEASNLGSMTVEKDSVLVMQPNESEPTVVTQGITQDDWDQWVADRESHAEMANGGHAPDGDWGDPSEVPYGWSDLAQNGVWSEIPGEGAGWIPTVSVDWSPYSSGQWCWYPGWGFTWIGSEPWGWLPYHFGGWEFVSGRGWIWFPGSLKNWLPAQVTWYQGPDWVGWIPRGPRHKPLGPGCGNNCGGGIVSSGTFRRGGLLTHSQMLGISPVTGTHVTAPRVGPTNANMLPGPAAADPSTAQHGFSWKPSRPQTGTGVATAPHPTTGPHRGANSNHNPSIVYDPQQGTYVNSPHTPTTIVQPSPRTVPPPSNAVVSPVVNQPANPGSSQQVPGEVRQPVVVPPVHQEPVMPNYGFHLPVRPTSPVAVTPPAPNPSVPTPPPATGSAQPSAGAAQAGSNRGGGWAPAAGRGSTPPPASSGGNGGRSTPPPSGGTSTGGRR